MSLTKPAVTAVQNSPNKLPQQVKLSKQQLLKLVDLLQKCKAGTVSVKFTFSDGRHYEKFKQVYSAFLSNPCQSNTTTIHLQGKLNNSYSPKSNGDFPPKSTSDYSTNSLSDPSKVQGKSDHQTRYVISKKGHYAAAFRRLFGEQVINVAKGYGYRARFSDKVLVLESKQGKISQFFWSKIQEWKQSVSHHWDMSENLQKNVRLSAWCLKSMKNQRVYVESLRYGIDFFSDKLKPYEIKKVVQKYSYHTFPLRMFGTQKSFITIYKPEIKDEQKLVFAFITDLLSKSIMALEKQFNLKIEVDQQRCAFLLHDKHPLFNQLPKQALIKLMKTHRVFRINMKGCEREFSNELRRIELAPIFSIKYQKRFVYFHTRLSHFNHPQFRQIWIQKLNSLLAVILRFLNGESKFDFYVPSLIVDDKEKQQIEQLISDHGLLCPQTEEAMMSAKTQFSFTLKEFNPHSAVRQKENIYNFFFGLFNQNSNPHLFKVVLEKSQIKIDKALEKDILANKKVEKQIPFKFVQPQTQLMESKDYSLKHDLQAEKMLSELTQKTLRVRRLILSSKIVIGQASSLKAFICQDVFKGQAINKDMKQLQADQIKGECFVVFRSPNKEVSIPTHFLEIDNPS